MDTYDDVTDNVIRLWTLPKVEKLNECVDIDLDTTHMDIPSNFLVLNIVKNQRRAHTKPTQIPGS